MMSTLICLHCMYDLSVAFEFVISRLSDPIYLVMWKAQPQRLLFFPRDQNLEEKLINHHRFLYSDRPSRP